LAGNNYKNDSESEYSRSRKESANMSKSQIKNKNRLNSQKLTTDFPYLHYNEQPIYPAKYFNNNKGTQTVRIVRMRAWKTIK